MHASVLIALTISLLPVLCDCVCAETAPTPPNVIFLMADDLGYGDVGFNGNTTVQTPNLDQMAADGIRFDRFYSVGSVCSPTRASCQTGRHYMRFGMTHVNVGKLPAQEINLPRIAKAQGYTTGHFGKWHIGTLSKTHTQVRGKHAEEGYAPPWERSYDTTFATETNIATWDPLNYTGLRVPKHSCTFWSNGKQVPGDFKGSSEAIIMDRALSFIDAAAKSKTPFLSTIWFYAPHSPVRAGKEFLDLYPELPLGKQHYYGSISAIDHELGRLRSSLKKHGLDKNTLIFFCSDNGPEGNGHPPETYTPYQGANHGSARDFRGRKRYLYNGGICVPAFAYWPGVITPKQTIQEPVCVLDYVPTLNALTGYTMPDDRPLDGVNLLPLLKGQDGWKRNKSIPLAMEFSIGRLWNGFPEVALVADGYKYCGSWNKPVERDELYDIQQDPKEERNLAPDHAQRVQELKTELNAWVESCRKSFHGGDYPEPYTPQGSILSERSVAPENPASKK